MLYDSKCRAKCPYHCKSWITLMSDGYVREWGGGFLEDKTLTFQVGMYPIVKLISYFDLNSFGFIIIYYKLHLIFYILFDYSNMS